MIIAFLIALYGMGMGGASKAIILRCKDRECDGLIDHPEVIFAAAFWPIALFFIIGSYLVENIHGPTRIEKKRTKEIAVARHKAEVMAIETKAVREMERINGIGAR